MKPYKVILWDVYGTLVTSRAGDLQTMKARADELRIALDKVIANFDLEEPLCRYVPDKLPSHALYDWYIAGIEAAHDHKRARGIEFPEIRVEEIWLSILETLGTQGLHEPLLKRSPISYAREVALYFEHVANARQLYPEVCDTLLALHRRHVRQGIISNAQFYTRIQLNEMLREQSDGKIASMHAVFDETLVFFSCDFGVAKPDLGMSKHARNVLRVEGITPDQCLCVGNDMLQDIWCAKQCGFGAALFAGDENSVRWRRDDPRCATLEPDAVIRSHTEVMQFV